MSATKDFNKAVIAFGWLGRDSVLRISGSRVEILRRTGVVGRDETGSDCITAPYPFIQLIVGSYLESMFSCRMSFRSSTLVIAPSPRRDGRVRPSPAPPEGSSATRRHRSGLRVRAVPRVLRPSSPSAGTVGPVATVLNALSPEFVRNLHLPLTPLSGLGLVRLVVT